MHLANSVRSHGVCESSSSHVLLGSAPIAGTATILVFSLHQLIYYAHDGGEIIGYLLHCRFDARRLFPVERIIGSHFPHSLQWTEES